MNDLIKALTILAKYGDPEFPTHCEHDVMYISIEHSEVSEEDKAELDKLGVIPDNESGMFKSYRFGSA